MYDCFEYNGTLTDYTANTEWFWIIDSKNNYTDFNFDYRVPDWEQNFVQVFGDQHAKNSHTYLVNQKHTSDTAWQFHERTVTRQSSAPRFHATNMMPHEQEGERLNSNFFNFIKRMCNKTEESHIWITSSVCDYDNFNFTWHPDIGEEKFIHTFGDYTFYVPVQEFKDQIHTLQKLEWFDSIKIREHHVHAQPLPVNVFDLSTTCAEAIKKHTFTHHYEWFVEATNPMKDVLPKHYPTRWDDLNIDVFGPNKNVMCVPREAKSYIVDQLYDYPHIKYYPGAEIKSKFPIYFFSYEETNADENYQKLKDRNLDVIRMHDTKGIGMVHAYKQAAAICEAPYFWAVFAKSQVHPDFNFDFEPDRLAESKCYAFDSYIPINGLPYGGYGIKLYPTNIVRNINDWGVDFSCSMPFEHVKILSTIAEFNQTPYMTWRSAFRECAKLSAGVMKMNKKSEDKMRLDAWCSIAEGKNSEWCLKGANQGKEFGLGKAESELMCLYDENWLKAKFKLVNATSV